MDKQKENMVDFLYEFRNANHMMGTTKEMFEKYISFYDDEMLLKLFNRRVNEVVVEQKHLLNHEYFKN